MPARRAQAVAFFAFDMAPRVVVAAVGALVLAFLYRRLVGPLSFTAWALIVTAITSLALARLCGSLLLVTAASMVDGGPSTLTSESSRHAATALASPHLTRFYLARLTIYIALGLALGLLLLLLELFASPAANHVEVFITGPMVGVVYGYLATGWDLAKRASAVSPDSGR